MQMSYRLVPVNTWTWDSMPYESQPWQLVSASVTKEVQDGSPLLESGSFTISAPLGYEFYDFTPGWYRLEAKAADDFESTTFPIATMWVYATSDIVDHHRRAITLVGKSVLLPLSERMMLKGDFISKGSNAIDKVLELVRDATPAPVSALGSFTINDYYVFDPGTKYLDTVWGLLKTAGWCIQISPDGSIVLREKPVDAKYKLSEGQRSTLRTSINRSYDRSDIPNRYKVIDRFGNEAVVENTNPDSKASYSAIGRWIDVVDTAPQQKDGESLLTYARRQLEYESTVSYLYTYSRRWIEGLNLFDIIEATLPNDGISGELRITRQMINCEKKLLVDETAGYEIKEFKA